MGFLTFLLAVLIFFIVGNLMYVIISPRSFYDNKLSNVLSLFIMGFFMYQFDKYNLLNSLQFLILSNLFIIIGVILIVYKLKKNKK